MAGEENVPGVAVGWAVRPDTFRIRAATAADGPVVRTLLDEYVGWLGLDLGFQGFDAEYRNWPGDYGPPRGACLVADVGGETVAMVALRPLDEEVCEMKRLFVRPSARGLGLGQAMIERVIDEARRLGYREMRLDTLPVMDQAQGLYAQAGFRDIAPYYDTPIAGTRFMALALDGPRRE